MTVREVEVIEEKLDRKKNEKIKLESKLENLMELLKTEFEINSIEEAQKILKEEQEALKDLRSKCENYEDKLQELLKDFI